MTPQQKVLAIWRLLMSFTRAIALSKITDAILPALARMAPKSRMERKPRVMTKARPLAVVGANDVLGSI